MVKDKKHFILLLLIFILPTLYLLSNTYLLNRALYFSSPDGDLYLSIADNFLKNGHFIQTARPNNINMVVPPGLPIILTILKLIVNDVKFIVLFQYILFGLTNVYVFLCSKNLFKNNISGVIAVSIYTITISQMLVCTPSYILTETYTLFIIVLALYILSLHDFSWQKRLSLIIPVLFIGYLIRPVLCVLWILSMFAMIIMLLMKKFNIKKALLLIILPSILLTLNVLLNYRETGDIIFIENYSGIGVYQANNINTKASTYSYIKLEEFTDVFFIDIYFNNSLTMTEKNTLLKTTTKEFVRQHYGFVLKNTAIKYYYLFIKNYKLSFIVFLTGILFFSIYDKGKRKIYYTIILSFILLSSVTSMGLNIARYSIIALPFYSVINAGLIGQVLICIINLNNKYY